MTDKRETPQTFYLQKNPRNMHNKQ